MGGKLTSQLPGWRWQHEAPVLPLGPVVKTTETRQEREASDVRVVVTGGAGFIGSHLSEELVRRGFEVVALDDLSTGSLVNLEKLKDDPSFSLVEGSVLDERLVRSVVSGSDCVVHLAAAVGVRLVMERPLESFVRNVRGTEVVIGAAEEHGVKVMVASTSEVYGKNRAGVFSEEADFVYGPTSVTRWTYALSKATDEVLAYYHYRERGLATVIMRFFNTVGPRQSAEFGMVLPTFARQAIAGEPLTVFGDGTQTRCFCHVSDTVRAILALMDDPGAVGGTFNIGSNEPVAIVDAARRVIEKTGSSSEIRFVPLDEAYGPGFEDIARREPDISRIREMTGWEPTYGFEEILDAIIEDVKVATVTPR
jgi:UDP-glucose 4-epimerase